MLLEAWRSIHQIYKRGGEGHLETSWIGYYFLYERFRTRFSTPAVALERKPSSDSMRVGEHPSLLLVNPFRIHKLLLNGFQFVWEADCGIIVYMFEASVSLLYGCMCM